MGLCVLTRLGSTQAPNHPGLIITHSGDWGLKQGWGVQRVDASEPDLVNSTQRAMLKKMSMGEMVGID